MKKALVANILLSIFTIFLLILILEVSLRPFVIKDKNTKTTIFIRDNALGWRLRPDFEDIWGGVKVKINGKGLRGPELDYDKPADVFRILYLGDSITFGYVLKSYEQTFPYLIEDILEDRFVREIETINAGVGGYSPWQEYIYLSREGIKYNPDLVVVAFVLNDVTEKFGLVRFGGTGEGFQLSKTSIAFDRLSSKSNIMYLAKKISARIRFGSDIQKGAIERETLDVESLVYYPDRPEIKRAWKITLENLGRIFDFCKNRDIPIILVVFPFTFQFDEVNTLSTPQTILNQYAVGHEIPMIDLLPILSDRIKEKGAKPEDYFLDLDHLSPAGSKDVAQIIADFIQNKRLITP